MVALLLCSVIIFWPGIIDPGSRDNGDSGRSRLDSVEYRTDRDRLAESERVIATIRSGLAEIRGILTDDSMVIATSADRLRVDAKRLRGIAEKVDVLQKYVDSHCDGVGGGSGAASDTTLRE